MSEPLDIVAVNVERRIAILDDGTQIPVTNLLDADGDEALDPLEATAFVAGPGPQGQWFAAKFEDFGSGRNA